MQYSYSECVCLLKVIADETRLKIIGRLAKGECCACELLEELNITQPTLSYHMKMLTGCELVNGRKDGIWMRYSLNPDKTKLCRTFMEELLNCENTQVKSSDCCSESKN